MPRGGVRRRSTPVVRYRVARRKQLVERLIWVLDHLVPAREEVVVVSFPDLDDNVVALLRSDERPARLCVLTNDHERARRRAAALRIEVALLPRLRPRGMWRWLRASTCVSTHGVFGSRRRGAGKVSVGLWHGDLGKAVGRAAGELPQHYDRAYAANGLSAAWRSAELGLVPESVREQAMPRHEVLVAPGRQLDPTVPRVVWAPTYRVPTTGLNRPEGDAEALETLISQTLELLGPVLERRGAELWLRLHPAALAALPTARRVHDASDAALERHGLTCFELLALSHGLVTDYSSMWVDYLLTGRPMVGAMPDAETYLAQRRMQLEPYRTWFPGPVVATAEQVAAEVDAVLAGTDAHRERRHFLRETFHPHPTADASQRLWRDLGDLGEAP